MNPRFVFSRAFALIALATLLGAAPALAADDYTLSAIVAGIVNSDAFRYQGVEETRPQAVAASSN